MFNTAAAVEDDDIVFSELAPIVANLVVVRKKVRVFENTHWTACGIPMHMHHIETRISFEVVPSAMDDEL